PGVDEIEVQIGEVDRGPDEVLVEIAIEEKAQRVARDHRAEADAEDGNGGRVDRGVEGPFPPRPEVPHGRCGREALIECPEGSIFPIEGDTSLRYGCWRSCRTGRRSSSC